jgi:hypothetical protein
MTVRSCMFSNPPWRLFSQMVSLDRDAVATDIVHQHSGRLDYYKGLVILLRALFDLIT